MQNLLVLKQKFEAYLAQNNFPEEYQSLYAPANYIMGLGGKRIRPILVLAALDALGKSIDEGLNAAMSVEVFHNFTLVHDDIMDAADIRRGKETVHKKWDVNTAVLSGDVMLIDAYDWLLTYPDHQKELIALFTKTAREVCVGQRLDMDFEERDDVSISEYIHMISYKTAVLLGCALRFGGIIAGLAEKEQKHLYSFGLNLGIAFQIQDDLIDTFGDESKTGKKKGGDILQNKKTYLYLKSLEQLSPSEVIDLKALFKTSDISDEEKIDRVTKLFKAAFVQVHAEELRNGYRDLALSHLAALGLADDQDQTLLSLVEFLQSRTS